MKAISRRRFVNDASLIGLLAAMLPEMAAAQEAASQTPAQDVPHDSYDFWNGFFDAVNPMSENYGKRSSARGPADQLPDPAAETQYLHYNESKRRLRYATDIARDELMDHDGDVAVNISLSQYHSSADEPNMRACLESVRWADELVVVDSHSADKTSTIAREFHIKRHGDSGSVSSRNHQGFRYSSAGEAPSSAGAGSSNESPSASRSTSPSPISSSAARSSASASGGSASGSGSDGWISIVR